MKIIQTYTVVGIVLLFSMCLPPPGMNRSEDPVPKILTTQVVYYAKPIIHSAVTERINPLAKQKEVQDDYSNQVSTIMVRNLPDKIREENLKIIPLSASCELVTRASLSNDSVFIDSLPRALCDTLIREGVTYCLLMYDVRYKSSYFVPMTEPTDEDEDPISLPVGITGKDSQFSCLVSFVDVFNNKVLKQFLIESDEQDFDFSEKFIEDLFDELGL